MSERQTLRNEMKFRRKKLTEKQQQNCTLELATYFSQHILFRKSSHIAFYVAHEGEIDPHALLDAAHLENKICYLPVIDPHKKNHLCFIEYSPGDTLIPNRYKIPEPQYDSSKIIPASELDLVLLPVVAFDKKGNRLGMGAGFYDRTFQFLKKEKDRTTKLIGLAYTFQRVENLIAQEWDVPLDGIVTEEGYAKLDHEI